MKTSTMFLILLLAVSAHAADRPNIVFILADDLGYGDVGCYNPESKVPTPNLDKLAASGVLFRQAIAAIPETGPSVSTILTGLHPHRHGARRADTGRIQPTSNAASRDASALECSRSCGSRHSSSRGCGQTNPRRWCPTGSPHRPLPARRGPRSLPSRPDAPTGNGGSPRRSARWAATIARPAPTASTVPRPLSLPSSLSWSRCRGFGPLYA